MAYQYKCVAAPEKAKRQRGAKTRTERVALVMQELINAEAVDGWEYQRTDLVPVEERSSMLGRLHEVHRAVLIFRREDPMTARTVGYEERRVATPPPQAAEPPIRLQAEPTEPPRPVGSPRPPKGLE